MRGFCFFGVRSRPAEAAHGARDRSYSAADAVRDSSSQRSGIATGASLRARSAQLATLVAPRTLRSESVKMRPRRICFEAVATWRSGARAAIAFANVSRKPVALSQSGPGWIGTQTWLPLPPDSRGQLRRPTSASRSRTSHAARLLRARARSRPDRSRRPGDRAGQARSAGRPRGGTRWCSPAPATGRPGGCAHTHTSSSPSRFCRRTG